MFNELIISGLQTEIFMENYIADNISFLVKFSKLTQDDFGNMFDLKKGVINQYIQKKSLPKIETIQKISAYFKVSIDDLINLDLSTKGKDYRANKDVATVSEPGTAYKKDDTLVQALKETIEAQKITIEAQQHTIQACKIEIDTLRNKLDRAS